jgi:hypothetical protein
MEFRSIRFVAFSLAIGTGLGIAAGFTASEDPSPGKIVHPLMTGVTNPEVVPYSRQNPVYPERWRSQHLGARVILQGTVDKWGLLSRLRVLKTDVQAEDCDERAGDPEAKGKKEAPAPPEAARDFEASALGAVKKWKFRPGTVNGVPVAVFHTLVIDFTSCPSSTGAQSPPSP